jgi:hypothetical protein
MRSLIRVVAVLLVMMLLSAQLAAAKAPTRGPFIQDPVTFAAGKVCSFQVRLENVRGGQTIKTYANGTIKITGAVWTRVTNLDSSQPRSVTVNSSGPATITWNSDGTATLKATGPTLFFFYPGNLGEGRDGALLRMTGLVTERLSADLTELIPDSFSHPHGITEDLCQTLLE